MGSAILGVTNIPPKPTLALLTSALRHNIIHRQNISTFVISPVRRALPLYALIRGI